MDVRLVFDEKEQLKGIEINGWAVLQFYETSRNRACAGAIVEALQNVPKEFLIKILMLAKKEANVGLSNLNL